MAHPFYHAVSSSRKLGGTPADHQHIHDWFDKTKSHLANWRHRALRHSAEGKELAARIFGEYIETSAGAVSTRDIAHQHILEDCGFIPTGLDWTANLAPDDWMLRVRHENLDRIVEASIKRFGGTADEHLPVHAFLDGEGTMDPIVAGLTRHHAAGIFLAEEVFGTTVTIQSRPVPTRYLAELHVNTEVGRIPSVNDWLKRISVQGWMTTVGEKHVGEH